MLPLFDMMLQAQNGSAMDVMAKQFNLAQEQSAKAIAALMPAFSSGFRRSASDPYNFTGVMQAIGSGTYAKYFEDVSKAFTPEGIADGNNVLQRLFGSKDVSRAIAAQAAQMTGIGQEIYKKMLPSMADTLMGGLFKETSGQMQMPANPFINTDMGEMMQNWLQTMGFAPKKAPMPHESVFDHPFTQAMGMMFGAQAPKRDTAAGNPFLDNPFAKSFQDMMRGFPFTPEPPKKPAAKPEAPAFDVTQYATMLNTMFDSGLEVQKNYQKSMESIFERYAQPSPSADAPKKK
ncbi:DUF937 domain-containing protein [Rhizobium tubonense]|uniref:DUF937 domain-containing protein n=1 Tax=Rhizobium tubonense TaxID=484088 RepID=A0A2W4E9A8_9HYPH|nr:DUF937 domain-containing protein [Rhizobium tubonense]PZM11916.1 hypothetical protein CPY51_17530 [Rhizobium tubonense]